MSENEVDQPEAVPTEIRKAAEIDLKLYIEAEPGSFHEVELLNSLMEYIWSMPVAYRRYWRNKLAELPNGKALTKAEFDAEQKRIDQDAKKMEKAAANLLKKDEPKTAQITFQKFPEGKIVEQVLQGGRVMFAVYMGEGKEVMYRPEIRDEEAGITYMPYTDELIEKGVVWLPEKAENYQDTLTLLEDIREFIHTYLEIDEIYERLASYYILFTWVYDSFENLPYLRALGDTGTGKSRFLSTIGLLCYKPMMLAGAVTAAPIYRVIEIYKGSMIIDEADFKDSDLAAEIVKILNVGFQKHYPIVRMELNGSEYVAKAHSSFCPKILATRDRFKDEALENRIYTVIMQTCTRRDIPILLTPEFYEKAQGLRNQLLMFRFRNLASAKVNFSLVNETIEPRLNQILVPLASIIEEEDFREEFNDIMEQYQKEVLMDRSTRWEYEVVTALMELRDTKLLQHCTMGEIAEVVNQHREENEEKMSAHRAGSIVRRKLYLSTTRKERGYVLYFEDNQERLDSFARRYGLLQE